MKNTALYLLSFLLLTPSSVLLGQAPLGQIPLNPAPTRVVGQNGLFQSGVNLVEGREFNQPNGVALDLNVSPPILYVADSANNRVLGFRNANTFSNGQKADIVIGQVDLQSTSQQGPRGAGFRLTGLTGPTGLIVDANSNLYVADSGNNRILRFPKPFTQTNIVLPDLVLGQPSFSTRTANSNGISANSMALANDSNGSIYQTYMALDSSQNLWVADVLNNRVLRYQVSVLGANASSGPAADLVLGQLDFASNGTPTTDPTNLTFFILPTGIAFDLQGKLFVSDSQASGYSRILVYSSPVVRSGQSANRIIGVVPSTVVPQPLPISEQRFGGAQRGTGSLFIINNGVGIADSQNSRLIAFRPADLFSSNVLTQQAQSQYLFGQQNFSVGRPNQGLADAGPDRLAFPAAVAVSGTELFIADSSNNRVIVVPYSSASVGQASRVLGQDSFTFNSPNLVEGREFRFTFGPGPDAAGVVTDLNSNPPHLYVADTYNNRILGYRDLRTVKPGDRADIVVGQPDFFHTDINYPSNNPDTPNASGLNAPSGLAVDPSGNLLVADTGNGRVLRFASPFAQTDQQPPANLVIGQRNFTSNIPDASAATMAAPYGLALTSNGLLVSDYKLNRILYFPGGPDQLTNGETATIVFGQADFTSSATGSSAADNRFNSPRAISTDSDNRLYVADFGNNRVVVFENAPGQSIDPRSSRSLPNLDRVRGVYVNPLTGEIWAATFSSLLRFFNYNSQPILGFGSNLSIPDTQPISVTQDAYGNLYTADASNRVQINYPGLRTVSAASFLNATAQPLAPGSIATIFGFTNQFGTATAAASSTPLPLQLAGVQVLLNNSPVPLYYVGPNQINFVLPQGAPTNGNADLLVSRADTGQVLGNFPIPLNTASPAIFTLDPSTPGRGQVAAINQDGSINGKDHPAPNSSVVSFFGTGEGVVPNAPPDGVAPPNSPIRTATLPKVIIGTDFVPDDSIQYSGLAPGLVGVWQVNVVIPEKVVATTSTNLTPVVFQVNGIASNGANAGGNLLQTTMWVTGKK